MSETPWRDDYLSSAISPGGVITWTTGFRWQDIPEGYYAFPVMGYDLISADDDPDTWEAPLLGHQTYRRQVSRPFGNGRVTGSDRFIRGVAWRNPDTSPEVADFSVNNVYTERAFAISAIFMDHDGANLYRGIYGQVTGRCGFCRKPLTDPKSVLIGIGPDCRGFR